MVCEAFPQALYDLEINKLDCHLIGAKQSRCIHVDMRNGVAEAEGMVCGGQMKVLIEDVSHERKKRIDRYEWRCRQFCCGMVNVTAGIPM